MRIIADFHGDGRTLKRAVPRFAAGAGPGSLISPVRVNHRSGQFLSFPIHIKTSPLRIQCRSFESTLSVVTRFVYRRNFVRPRRGFILQTVTSFHRPRLCHYYGFICHLTPHRRSLEFPLEVVLPCSDDARLPQLLNRLPDDDYVPNH